jgi:recombinational DNA repair protein (RecF pathway)
MAYHTYTTNAYILHAAQLGEHDVFYICMTESFGLIRARATGARKEDSKLRYSLQIGSCVALSLVKGKAGWRVTGAVLLQEPHRPTITLFAKLARLSERLVHGEEQNDALYAVFCECTTYADVRTAELWLVMRVLVSLGYLSPQIIEVIESKTVEDRHTYLESNRPVLLKTVNNALESSHL